MQVVELVDKLVVDGDSLLPGSLSNLRTRLSKCASCGGVL